VNASRQTPVMIAQISRQKTASRMTRCEFIAADL
jgi:hypothetical protein